MVAAIAELRENHTDLPPLAQHIEDSYRAVLAGQPAERAAVYKQAKEYCVQAVSAPRIVPCPPPPFLGSPHRWLASHQASHHPGRAHLPRPWIFAAQTQA